MFKYIIIGTALLIAACAGLFSVTGIGQLFVGAPLAAMVMAGALELAKLVTVSFVYRYWKVVNAALRAYFTVAALVLMFITSVGIYGYLTAAYATSAATVNATNNQITLAETQKKNVEGQIDRLNKRIDQLQALRGQQETRLDQLIGKNGYQAQQRAIRESDQQISQLQGQVNALTIRRDSIETASLNKKNSITTTGKIGTFYYIAEMMGVNLDTVAKWFILSIVLVFDPLSVTLIIAYNIIVKNEKKEEMTPEEAVADELSELEEMSATAVTEKALARRERAETEPIVEIEDERLRQGIRLS